jgi:uncharacterized protein YqjF (DUF2071 family)
MDGVPKPVNLRINKFKDHPFAVEAFFKRSTVLTFSVKKEFLELLLPACLQLDTFDDTYGFVAAALVETQNLRPKGLPEFLGRNFYLIGYRVFVKYINKQGKVMRGLYILKSETNKASMAIFGNIFTHYNYTTTDISLSENDKNLSISSLRSDFQIDINKSVSEVPIPHKSPFADWKQARKFAGPLPFTFTVNEQEKTILIIEGVRQNWKPKPLSVDHCHFGFLESQNWGQVTLANAFEIENVPYWWKKGRLEKW